MPIRASDVKVGKVVALRADGGRAVARLRFEHPEHRPDRWWSWCELDVELPPGAAAPATGTAVEVVLGSVAEASRVADAPGHYSCRLHPALRAPELPPDRSTEGVHGGLIERTEPPDRGELVLHLGSGLTCYPRCTGEGPFPPESLVHGEWAEFILVEPHALAHWRPLAAS